MNYFSRSFVGSLILGNILAAPVFAGKAVKMAITTAPQSVVVGKCSALVKIQAQDYYSNPTTVPVNTTIFFTGSSSSLKFYSNNTCTTAVSTLTMAAATGTKSFYFKGSVVGTQKIIVATYNYVDATQFEKILAAPSPTPTPTPTPLPTVSPTPTPIPTPSPTPPSTVGRPIPAPIYGVTLDDVADYIRPGEITSLKMMNKFPTARIVFDGGVSASYYVKPVQELRPYAYIMGEIADSVVMSGLSVSAYQSRAQSYVNTLGSNVDLWEIGNEVNGGWLGTYTEDKIQAAYNVVTAAKGATALTFFWEGEESDYCWDSPKNHMFTWINNMFQLDLPPNQRNPEREKLRLGLNYALVSWYPEGCYNIQPDWTSIFNKLAGIFPNSKVGFGEIGTAKPQYGSTYEINLINQFYPLAKNIPLPSSYVGGYFWWNFAEEMVPYTSTLFGVLNNAIK